MTAEARLENMGDEDWQTFLGAYGLGYEHGIRRGIEIADQHWRGLASEGAAIARMVAEAGPYADLLDRRGEHEQATEFRALLAERGIS